MAIVRKTRLIDQEMARSAQGICGARAQEETASEALREIAIRHQIDAAFQRHGHGLADIQTGFPDPPTC